MVEKPLRQIRWSRSLTLNPDSPHDTFNQLVLGSTCQMALFDRSNMIETRVYNEWNVIVSTRSICAFFAYRQPKSIA
jgi:hypothetical protein